MTVPVYTSIVPPPQYNGSQWGPPTVWLPVIVFIFCGISKMALLCSAAVRAAPLRLCFYLLFYLLLISIFTHITSALITYDKSALLDIGNRFTNLVQDTLSPNPSCLLRFFGRENKGHRRRNKKTPWKKRWDSEQIEEKGSQSSFTEPFAR